MRTFLKRSLAFALAMALMLSLCPMIPLTVKAEMETDGWTIHNFGTYLDTYQFYSESGSFEYVGDAPYDWMVLFGHHNKTQLRFRTIATVTDANGNVIGTGLDEKSCKGGIDQNLMDPSLILDENGNPALTTDLFGVFTITVDILYVQGGGATTPVATMVKQFSRVPIDGSSAYAKVEQEGEMVTVLTDHAAVSGMDFASGTTFELNPSAEGAYWAIPADQGMAITLSETFMEHFNGTATVTVEYYDSAAAEAEFIYHGAESTAQVHQNKLATTGDNTMALQTATFELPDAVLANGCDNGLSFVVKATSGTLYIKSISVINYIPEKVITYTTGLTSEAADLKFYDEAPFDLNLTALTDGESEDVTVSYRLDGGNLAAAVIGSQTVTLTPEAIVLLDAAWFNQNAVGYGKFTLDVTIYKSEVEVAKQSFQFIRTYSSILESALHSDIAENKNDILVFSEDATLDLQLLLKNKLSESFAGTLTYTVSKDGVALEGFDGQTVAIADLLGDASAVVLPMPEAAEYGTYALTISITDGEGAKVHSNSFLFARVKTDFVSANISSATASDVLVFVDDAPYDLVLNLQKNDGYAETLSFTYEILKGEEAVKNGSFSLDVPVLTATELDLSEILADVNGYGDFTLKLTATNTLGYSKEVSFGFSRNKSIQMTLTSAGNAGENLQFLDNAVYDLQLSLLKASGEDRVMTVRYTIAKGEETVKTGSIENASITDPATVLDLDMTGVEGNGTFIITVDLVDAEGNIASTSTFQVSRISSMTTQLVHPCALVLGGEVTYIDYVPYDIALNVAKLGGAPEDVTVNYIVTDAEGNQVAIGSTTVTVVANEPASAALDLSGVTGFGNFHLAATVLDASGNQVAEASLPFVRWDTIASSLASESNPDLVFTDGEAFDLVLNIANAAGSQKLALTYTITGDNLETPYSFSETLRTASFAAVINNYTDLTGLTAAGTYTLTLTIVDDAGRLREDVSYTFHRVALEGTVASTISSESSPELVFIPGGSMDMTLNLQKTDAIAEGFTAALTITDKDGNELAKGEAALEPFVDASWNIQELVDLAPITASGVYTLKLTLTDNAGNLRHEATASFTLVALEGSVDSAVTSAANSDMIFTEGEAFDLTLHLRKNDGIAEKFNALVTVTNRDGQELKKLELPLESFIEQKVELDLSGLPSTGNFNLNVVLIDQAGNERLNTNTAFYRVKVLSVQTSITSASNPDYIFTEFDGAFDLTMYVKKTDGIEENLNLHYRVYLDDSTVVLEGQRNIRVGSQTFQMLMEDVAQITDYNIYNIDLTVTDNSGIVRSQATTRFCRITNEGLRHQVVSASGGDLVFTDGRNFDMYLYLQKTDKTPEKLMGYLQVTDSKGNIYYTAQGYARVPKSPAHYELPIKMPENAPYDTYKIVYTLHDDAGNLRASETVYFSRISAKPLDFVVKSASDKPGMIYGKNDPMDLTLYIKTSDGVAETLQARYTVTDMNGLVLDSKQGKISVPATGVVELPLEFADIEALNNYGIYNLKLEIADSKGKSVLTQDYSFSRVLTPVKQLDIMGVCTHLSKNGMTTADAQNYVDLARKGGASFWRDELPWSVVEPAKGQYYFPESADMAVDYTLSIGLEPLFILDYGNNNYGTDVTTDEWLEGYLGYVRAMVTHFKGRIKYYEVWNEWNVGVGGLDKKYRDQPELYAKILVATYKTVKEIDPEITVIGGVVAGAVESWIEGMLKYPEAANSFDVFSFHTYTDGKSAEDYSYEAAFQTVADLLDKYREGERPEVWMTETGWPTHIGLKSSTEEFSAANLVRLYTWALANPDLVDKVFWYDLHNDGVLAEEIESNFGLLRNWAEVVPMAAKKSYVAMCAMNAILADAEYVGTFELGRGIYAYRFLKDGKDLLVAWVDGECKNMVASIGENNMIVTDMYGNASALTPVNGKVSLFLSDSPIYIEYDLSNALELTAGGFKLDANAYTATPAATFPVQITRNSGLETYSGTYSISLPEGWSVSNVEFGAAEAGATKITDTIYVTVSSSALQKETNLTVKAISDGKVMGQFVIPVTMDDICTVNPTVVFTENGADFQLAVEIVNETSNAPLTGTINLLAPTELFTGNTKVAFEVPAGENKAVLIDVPEEVANKFYNIKLEVSLDGGDTYAITKPVSFLYAIEAPENMKLDGVIDDQWADAMEFSAGQENWLNHTGSDLEWPGNTFKGYAMWDNEYLYVAIQVQDVSHYQEGSGTSIWMGDSVQLATDIARHTKPGSQGYNEIGFSLSSDGTDIQNWNWNAAPGRNLMEGGIFKIVRDNATGTTTYEVAMPWNALLPDGTTFDLQTIGFSLLVNENSLDEDGEPTGRTGWIEYMSGVGVRKDPMLFGDLILAKRPEK